MPVDRFTSVCVGLIVARDSHSLGSQCVFCFLGNGSKGIPHKVGSHISRGLFLSRYSCRWRCEVSVLYMSGSSGARGGISFVYTPTMCFGMFVNGAGGVGIVCTTPPLLHCPSTW